MSTNPLTTARINRTVYDLRHWKLTLFVGCVLVLFRFLFGRDLRGGRTTDATFFRGARRQRRGWWASLPGAARAGLRLSPFVALWAWNRYPTWTLVAGGLVLAVVVWRAVVRVRTRLHDRRVLQPVWPAVAGIIGVPVEESASVWLDIPPDMTADDAEIVVGLRAADPDDERRVAQLVTLFDQRFGAPHIGAVDYARRLVYIRPKPPESKIWPAVAAVLGVSTSELASDWLEVPDDTAVVGAKVVITLPADSINDDPLVGALHTLLDQRFGASKKRGDWSARTDRTARRVTFTRQPGEADPPKEVRYDDLDLTRAVPTPRNGVHTS